ncbi:MAG: hypothetical protein JNL01_14640 [Bdellovibrionales bacterium]|nr:hypothetical protein [Bdellovibrionales bacterium]
MKINRFYRLLGVAMVSALIGTATVAALSAYGATYNFYFNNTEQGDGSTATPNLSVAANGVPNGIASGKPGTSTIERGGLDGVGLKPKLKDSKGDDESPESGDSKGSKLEEGSKKLRELKKPVPSSLPKTEKYPAGSADADSLTQPDSSAT